MKESTLHILWLTGASCDGCSMAMLGASEPGLEDVLLGRVPHLPAIELVHPLIALPSGESYLEPIEQAASGELAPFVLVLEGSSLDRLAGGDGSFSRIGPPRPGESRSTAWWLERLAPRAEAVVAIGSCAAWGGVPAAAGSPTDAEGLERALGRDFRSRAGLPVVNVPGCAPRGATFLEALVQVIYHLERIVPLELDEDRRPAWLYRETTPPVPPRTPHARTLAGNADETDRPSVGCPVPGDGWLGGLGGCERVGGACIGCTDRDFTDRHLRLSRTSQISS